MTTFTSKFDAVLAGKAQLSRGTGGLRPVPRQGPMQRLSPRRPAWGGSAVHRFHRQHYRKSRQSATGCAGLRRQSGRIVIRRRRRWHLPHQGPSAQPTLRGRFAMAQTGAGQPIALSGTDAAQRGQAALPNLCQSVWTQRILHQPEVHSAFLQHARRPTALPAERLRRRFDMLARSGVDRQHEHNEWGGWVCRTQKRMRS